MMDYLTVFGGVGRIGGNSILIEAKDTNLLFDFGKDFEQLNLYFNFPERLPSRSINLELIKTGILPILKKSNGKDVNAVIEFEEGKIIKDEDETLLNGVFVSHAHSDHSGFINLLRRNVNVYMGKFTKVSYSSYYETIGTRTIDAKLYFEDFKNKQKERIKISTFSSKDKVKVNDVFVKPHAVDHSTPGSYGFIIETPNNVIVYTGDFRMHGIMRSFTEEFVKKLERYNGIDCLICEGTNVAQGRTTNEESVRKDAKELVNKALHMDSKLIMVDVRSTDLDRISTFYKIGLEFDLQIVISMRLAYLLDMIERHSIKERIVAKLPRIKDVFILTLKEKLKNWEVRLIEECDAKVIEKKDLRKLDKKMMIIDIGRINVFDIKPPTRSIYIKSTSEHVREEEEIGEESFMNSLALNGIITYTIHSSGHASPLELVQFVKRVKPRKIIPIHTEYPEMFKELFAETSEVIMPQKGMPIKLGG